MTLTVDFTYDGCKYHYVVERVADFYVCLDSDFVDCLQYDADYFVFEFVDRQRGLLFDVNIELDMQHIRYVAVAEVDEHGNQLDDIAMFDERSQQQLKLTIQ
jgi:hypothetical protein